MEKKLTESEKAIRSLEFAIKSFSRAGVEAIKTFKSLKDFFEAIEVIRRIENVKSFFLDPFQHIKERLKH